MERFINNNLEMSLWHYSNGPLPGKLFRQKNFQKVFPHIFTLFSDVFF